jgi:hypothetical protein
VRIIQSKHGLLLRVSCPFWPCGPNYALTEISAVSSLHWMRARAWQSLFFACMRFRCEGGCMNISPLKPVSFCEY